MADRSILTTDTLETFRTTYNSTAGDVGDITSLLNATGTIASSTDIVEAVVAMNTEIAALNTIAKIKEYEVRAYTEVRKVEVLNEDGSFKEYHASNTTTHAREINMCNHFSVNPNKVEAWFVSLTAD